MLYMTKKIIGLLSILEERLAGEKKKRGSGQGLVYTQALQSYEKKNKGKTRQGGQNFFLRKNERQWPRPSVHTGLAVL